MPSSLSSPIFLSRRHLLTLLLLSLLLILYLLLPSHSPSPANDHDPSSSWLRPERPPGYHYGTGVGGMGGIRQVVVDKVQANFGFGRGFIPDNERPRGVTEGVEDPTTTKKDSEEKDEDSGLGRSITPGAGHSANRNNKQGKWGWRASLAALKDRSAELVTSNKTFGIGSSVLDNFWSALNPFSSRDSGYDYTSSDDNLKKKKNEDKDRVTDWDDLPFLNKAFKEWEYSRSLSHEGTSSRIQRFLEKARSGKGFVVGVVGGSVSKGRGLPRFEWVKGEEGEGGRWVLEGEGDGEGGEEVGEDLGRVGDSEDEAAVEEAEQLEEGEGEEEILDLDVEVDREEKDGNGPAQVDKADVEETDDNPLITLEDLTSKRSPHPHPHPNTQRKPRPRPKPRALSSHFHPNPDPAHSQNLYNPLNLHVQIFDFLDGRFPARVEPGHEKREEGRGEKGGRDVPPTPTPPSTNPAPNSPPSYVYDWSALPPRGVNKLINGAQGGVGSDYFAGCWKEHLGEDVDLVVVELGINDVRDINAMQNYELLLRSLLEMPSRPAVINVQTFTLLFSTLSQASSLHTDVAVYYDTPVLSLRDVLLPRILNDPTSIPSPGGVLGPEGKAEQKVGLEVKKWFRNVPEEERIQGDAKVVDGVDLMHISHHAHSLLAELVIHYLQLQISQMVDYDLYLSDEEAEDDAELTDVPGMLLASAYTPNSRIRRSNPFCRSTNTAFEERRLTLPEDTEGWQAYNWGEKRYLVSSIPGSRITFPFYTRANPIKHGHDTKGTGYIKLGHLKSKVLGMGSVNCWVDEELARKTRVDAWWDTRERNMGIITTIREDLMPGPHKLTCEVLRVTADPEGGTEFRIISVVYD